MFMRQIPRLVPGVIPMAVGAACRLHRRVALIALLALLPTAARADLLGEARAIDGGSLEIAGQLVSLYAIDAPEAGELCQRADGTWPCGAAALKALQALADEGPLWCIQVVRNRHGSVSICRRDGKDVNEAMVAAGMARADRLYSSRYVPAEDIARAAGLGLWLGDSIAEVAEQR